MLAAVSSMLLSTPRRSDTMTATTQLATATAQLATATDAFACPAGTNSEGIGSASPTTVTLHLTNETVREEVPLPIVPEADLVWWWDRAGVEAGDGRPASVARRAEGASSEAKVSGRVPEVHREEPAPMAHFLAPYKAVPVLIALRQHETRTISLTRCDQARAFATSISPDRRPCLILE
jgi:hypothetical protein